MKKANKQPTWCTYWAVCIVTRLYSISSTSKMPSVWGKTSQYWTELSATSVVRLGKTFFCHDHVHDNMGAFTDNFKSSQWQYLGRNSLMLCLGRNDHEYFKCCKPQKKFRDVQWAVLRNDFLSVKTHTIPPVQRKKEVFFAILVVLFVERVAA